MPRLKRLSGAEVVEILQHFGFEIVSQRGSHVKVRRFGEGGVKETLSVPAHRELDTGICRAILRQASRYVSESELAPFFYAG